mmetsp:Transcript_9149/g.33551  ORF Transcript_9149/g.33551 Transcript_9149/m.33551 type:complete len:491 (-) Transcript_9149:3445-4917(-)
MPARAGSRPRAARGVRDAAIDASAPPARGPTTRRTRAAKQSSTPDALPSVNLAPSEIAAAAKDEVKGRALPESGQQRPPKKPRTAATSEQERPGRLLAEEDGAEDNDRGKEEVHVKSEDGGAPSAPDNHARSQADSGLGTAAELAPDGKGSHAEPLPTQGQAPAAHDPTEAGWEARSSQRQTRREQQAALTELAKAFWREYSRGFEGQLSVEEIASSLGTDRRRVYDIVSVFEALEILHRGKRKQYSWRGMQHLTELLGRLQRTAQQEQDKWARGPPPPTFLLFIQRFVGLCMESKPTYLENAAALLCGADNEVELQPTKQRTAVRRLYDIAKVLMCLGLLTKVPKSQSKKPAFGWVGEFISVDKFDNEERVRPIQRDVTHESLDRLGKGEDRLHGTATDEEPNDNALDTDKPAGRSGRGRKKHPDGLTTHEGREASKWTRRINELQADKEILEMQLKRYLALVGKEEGLQESLLREMCTFEGIRDAPVT